MDPPEKIRRASSRPAMTSMGKPSAASARGRKSRVLRATRKVFVATAHAVGVEAAQAFAEAFQHRDGAFDGLVAKALSVSSPAASRTVS